MNSPSYETFIRICQGCLININGTSPHPSNRSPCSPSPPSMCIFSPRVSSLTLFCLLSVSSLSCLYRPLMISSALTSISKAVPMEREGVESLFPPPLVPPLPHVIYFSPTISPQPSSLSSPPPPPPHLHILRCFSLCLFMQMTPSALHSMDPCALKTCGPAPFISVRLH